MKGKLAWEFFWEGAGCSSGTASTSVSFAADCAEQDLQPHWFTTEPLKSLQSNCLKGPKVHISFFKVSHLSEKRKSVKQKVTATWPATSESSQSSSTRPSIWLHHTLQQSDSAYWAQVECSSVRAGTFPVMEMEHKPQQILWTSMQQSYSCSSPMLLSTKRGTDRQQASHLGHRGGDSRRSTIAIHTLHEPSDRSTHLTPSIPWGKARFPHTGDAAEPKA